jgi:hypothetical protein
MTVQDSDWRLRILKISEALHRDVGQNVAGKGVVALVVEVIDILLVLGSIHSSSPD